MIEDLVKPSNEPDRWKSCADAVYDVLQEMDLDAARRKASPTVSEKEAEADRTKAVEGVKKVITLMQYAQWPSNRMLYTLGQLDTERLILCCEKKIADWQSVLNAKSAFGTAEDVRRIFEQARLHGLTPDLSHPLRFAAKPMLLVAGLRHEGNIDTTAQLLKMGADPATDNGQVFQTAVLEGRPDIGRVIARHGQNGLLDINPWVNWAKANRKLKAYDDFRQIQWEYGRFTVADYETLIETKPMPDNTGNLRIIFNFASRRVEEIHEFTNPKQNVITGFAFDEYGQAALEAAREKLIELGGNPSGLDQPLRGKASVAKPSVFGLGKT
ncbi:MAG: hypothetical protein ACAH83_06485 [Alphaproteobacteria bacterium]